jgi:hypothetical protein
VISHLLFLLRQASHGLLGLVFVLADEDEGCVGAEFDAALIGRALLHHYERVRTRACGSREIVQVYGSGEKKLVDRAGSLQQE